LEQYLAVEDELPSRTLQYPETRASGQPGDAAEQYADAYNRYISRTFEPIGPTPRSYLVAITSASAARGIAVGGTVSSEIRETPMCAIWVSNRKDDRFGRLFVEFPAADGRSITIGASRVFFSDSFLAAKSVLCGNHDAEATFREGEVLVLMSMDPDSSARRRIVALIEAKIEAIRDRLQAANVTSEQDLAKLPPVDREWFLMNARELEMLEQQAQAVRGIVTHPAIFGRELAWSAARVDFWFNLIEDLGEEAAMMNGGHEMPENLQNLDIAAAHTWQFYELDAAVELGQSDGKSRPLSVASKVPAREHERSRFGLSMFAFGETPPENGERDEDGFYRIPKLECEVQPMLDWLSDKHHDFRRLNDFSEAFSLLRWLKSKDVRFSVVDLIGQRQQLATPDHVIIGKGPKVGPRWPSEGRAQSPASP
jgi:hypothetical protein